MKKMKRIPAWILALAMALCFAAASGESALPEIPEFSGSLEHRLIGSDAEAIEFAQEFWALDYAGTDASDAVWETDDWGDTFWHVYASLGNRNLALTFDEDGNVLFLENVLSGWSDICHVFDDGAEEDIYPEDDSDEAAAWRDTLDRKLMYPFLQAVNPALYEEYIALYPLDEPVNETLTHYYGTWVEGESSYDLYYSESYSEDQFRIKIGVQTKPVIRIVYFDIFCDALEGGNG